MCVHNAIISVNIGLFDERYMFSERDDHQSLLVCLALASSSFKNVVVLPDVTGAQKLPLARCSHFHQENKASEVGIATYQH